MSLIEKAAKRLEELQRAGALLAEVQPAKLPAGAAETPASEIVPTPEAMVRKAKAMAPRSDANAPTGPPATTPASSRAAAETGNTLQPRRKVELDFVRLARQSYVTPDDPNSEKAHEFRGIKRPLIRSAAGLDGPKVPNGNLIAVTSSLPGEGKTYTAINLAISIAMEVDRTVMLVDGDVAHPSLPEVLGIPGSPGLLDYLVRDDLDLDDVLIQTNIDGLTILPAGKRDRRATEFLASEKMATFLHETAARFPDRFIIFDSPPLLPTTEAPVLAALMGQVVMVVGADTTARSVVREALALIEGCEVVLMLLNKAATSSTAAYYGYYADDDPQ
jgi:receptor protein-tyrosine kinase